MRSESDSFFWVLVPIILLFPNYFISECFYYSLRRSVLGSTGGGTGTEGLLFEDSVNGFSRQASFYSVSTPLMILAFFKGTAAAFETALLSRDTTRWNQNTNPSIKRSKYSLTALSIVSLYAFCILCFNIVVLIYSIVIKNTGDLTTILATIVICTANILLVLELVYTLTFDICLSSQHVSPICRRTCLSCCRYFSFRLELLLLTIGLGYLVYRIYMNNDNQNLLTIKDIISHRFRKLPELF
jgi:hypothetical protein